MTSQVLAIARSIKAQMKIQQMAFMIVAIVIFFSMIALIYFAISFSQLDEKAQALAEEEAIQIALRLSGTPELMFTSGSGCASCLDFDKAFALKDEDLSNYQKLWNLDYLQIEKVYPEPTNENCNDFTYPDCKFIKVKESTEYTSRTAFVTLVEFDPTIPGKFKYSLGRIHASAKTTQ